MWYRKNKIRTNTAIVVLLTILLSTTPALGREALLSDIVVTNSPDHLLVYFSVTECFTEDMKKAIDNGIITRFTFFVKLREVRRFWWDKTLADIEVNHDIQYENLKKVYLIKLSENESETKSVQDFEEAKRLMSEIIGLKITDLHNLERGQRYQVRMMAELDKIRLPFYLHHVLFFLSLWDFETDWYSVDFRY